MGKAAKHESAPAAAKPRTKGVSKNSAEARRKILDSATLIFGSQGFARTTTEQIAEHAGYGQATVFFHFKTKSGLLEACLEGALEQAKQNLVPAENSGTVELVRRLDRAFDNSPTADFFARMLIEFGESSAVQPVYSSFHAHVREVIAAELVRETGADEHRAATAAASILSMMVGIHAEQRLETKQFSRADFREMLLNVTRLILRDLTGSVGADP
ncbi:TetR/AcrR family transcriptional regulator [Novosphingobium aquae]|jgi:AcrR family transcriptional regulator|uniref:TetR/AcrR family transcriptional regulator n=1 Tax=Novosphingobium aquae TaxID=3133435 RepID=A0ABU8SD71_9SPHN